MHPWQRDLRRMRELNNSDLAKEIGAVPSDIHSFYFDAMKEEKKESVRVYS